MAQKKIGAKIVIDGEQEFRQALLQSKNAMKEFDSEMKLVTAQFKNNEKSMESLKSKQAVYQKQQQELTKQSKLLVEQIQKASVEYNKASTAQEKQAEKIKQLEKALEKAKKEYGDSADEVQQLEQELSEANAEYDKQQRAIDQLSNKITKWNTDLNKTQTELVETDRALKDTNDAIEHYDDNMDDAERETKEFGSTMDGAAKNTESLRVSLGSLVSAQVVVDVLRNCARAIKEVATAALDVGMKFEASMSNVEALSGATGETLEALGNKAKEMGAKTIYSASQSADAFSYMALAGWDAKQMLEGIEPVLNLAAAANMDLAEASDIVTDYITAFGLKAEDAAHFSDAMARAMSTSNTTVELLGESYKNCAATCGAMGISMEDATAVLATMANAGVKGGEAGTALNAILTRLATNTKNCNDKLKDLGIEVYNSEGTMNDLGYILGGLGEKWDDLSQKEQASLAKSIAGVSHYSKFQTIMLGVSEAAKEGGQSFEDYAAALRDCDGAAEEMAKTMQDNLTGDITILKSALEGLGIATEGVFDSNFREAVQGATDAIGRLQRSVTEGDLGVSLAGLSDSIGELTANLIDSAEEGLPGFIDGLSWLIRNLPDILGLVKTTAATYVAYQVATKAAALATMDFTLALEANPIGAVIGLVTALTVGFVELEKSLERVTYEMSEEEKETQKVIEESKTLNDSIRDNAESRKQEVAQMEAQSTAAKNLVIELYNEATTQERRAQIIAELRSLYPELNVSLNEHGEIIGRTQAQMEKYIDSSLKMAKVEAAKEHLTEIAKEQFEAEQELARIEEQVADAVLEVKRAETEANAEAQKHVDMNGNLVEVYNEYSMAVEGTRNELNNLRSQQDETRQSVTDLGDEYQKTLDYINENGGIIEDATQAEYEWGDAIERSIELTEDQIKEIEELGKAISSSVESSLDLTKKWSQEWNTTTHDMTQNVESQIEGVRNWAKNFDLLAHNSKVAIDENVMKYLAEMGTEGAGLVQQLVDTLKTSPTELKDWSETMSEYLSLQGDISSKITDSYIDVMEASMTGAADAIRENAGLVQDAAEEAIVEGLEGAGSKGTEALATGLEGGKDKVSTAANTVGDAALKGITDKTGTKGEKIGEIGEASDAALADGLNAGKAAEAAQTVSQEVYETVASTLSADAGDEIGSNFMGALGEALDSYGQKVLETARAIAEEAKNIMNNPLNNPPGGGGGGNVPGHADGLAYVPYDNYLARLHEGERVLTKEENLEYSALLGNVKVPSFSAIESKLAEAESRAVVINNDIKVDGAQDPEAWTQTFIRTLKREARMA